MKGLMQKNTGMNSPARNMWLRLFTAVVMAAAFWGGSVGIAAGATFQVPPTGEPGAMFLLEAAFAADDRGPVQISFDAKVMQYAGPVEPTPEIQSPRDGMIEITRAGGAATKMSLKFLPVPQAREAILRVKAGGPEQMFTVSFTPAPEKKSYHLHILVGAIFLLVLARFFWNVQKKNPSLMSTRSLFMNFEELKKVREEYGFQHPANPESSTSGSSSASSPASGSSSSSSSSSSPASSPSAAPIVPPTPPSSPSPLSPAPQNAQSAQAAPEHAETKPSHTISRRAPYSTSPTASPAETPVLSKKADVPEVPEVQTQERTAVSGDEPAGMPPFKADETAEAITMARPLAIPQGKTAIYLMLTDDRGETFAALGEEISMGRKRENTIVFTASEISRRHAVIKGQGEGFILEPLTDSNSTEVNGKSVSAAVPVTAGDRISLGGRVFQVTELKKG